MPAAPRNVGICMALPQHALCQPTTPCSSYIAHNTSLPADRYESSFSAQQPTCLCCLQVVRGAGLLYANTLLQIKQLSPSGAAQVAADAEYFCNVMSALAVAPPTALITVQLFAAAPVDTFEQMADGAVAAGSADVKVKCSADSTPCSSLTG